MPERPEPWSNPGLSCSYPDPAQAAKTGIPSPGMYPWIASGMLRWEADSLAAQPGWTRTT